MPKYSAPALEKGLDVLETLADSPGPLLLSELARRLERSQSELFRMVDCLERRGYLVRDEISGAFGLSLKLYELAHTHSPVEKLLAAARRPMDRLARAVRESCHLSVLHNRQLVVLAQAEDPEKVRVSVEVGARFSPIQTVSGRVLLAQLPEGEWPKFSVSQTRLRRIRETGCDTAENETIVGLRDVAVLVGNPEVGVTAALAIPSLMPVGCRDNTAELLGALRRAAQQITQTLGLTT